MLRSIRISRRGRLLSMLILISSNQIHLCFCRIGNLLSLLNNLNNILNIIDKSLIHCHISQLDKMNCMLLYQNGVHFLMCNSTGCISGQYAPAGTFYCLPCDLSCLTCSDATTCTSCGSAVSGSNLYLYLGACLMTCPDLFYPNSSTSAC
jgi:hypothetical protein